MAVKEFICDYCGKKFLRDDAVNKSQKNKHNYCCRKHYLEVAKKTADEMNKIRWEGTRIAAEKNRGLISGNIRGKETPKDREEQKRISEQITQEIKAEIIPHLKKLFEEQKQKTNEIIKQEGITTTSTETLDILLKIGKGVIKRLDDMWKQVEVMSDEDKLKRYKDWFVAPYVSIASELRKTAKDLEELRVGKKFVVEHKEKKSVDDWLIEDAKVVDNAETK